MVPGAFVFLEALPITAHGKVDRAALPDLEVERVGVEFVAPRTPLEARIVEACAEVLGLEAVGVGDNFFELGGHSLLATQLVSRLRERWGIELPVRAVFEARTLGDLAERVTGWEPAGRIPRRPEGSGPAPLSFAQERLWFLDRIEAGTAYSMPMALALRGELSVPAMEAAFGELVRRHENLRTTFHDLQEGAVQVVEPAGDWRLLLVDLTGVAEGREAEVGHLLATGAWRRFDLENGPLLRAALLRKGATEHLLILDMHHIVSDGWSMGVLIREVSALYAAALAGRPSLLPELPIQYADFAVWQRAWLEAGELERQLGYWRERLAGAPALDLPTDRPRPAVQSFRGATLRFEIAPEETRGLETLARQRDASLYMVLLALSQTLLGRYTGQEDLVTGGAIANRNRSELEPLIGFFVNSLVLRADLAGDPPFSDLLDRTRRTTLEAYSHQDLPFERLVEELQPERRLSHNPLFQVMCVLQNAPGGRIDLPGLRFEPMQLHFPTTRFDLEMMFWEQGEGLGGHFTYATDLFEEATVQRMIGHLLNLASGAIETPGRRLSDLPLLAPAERCQLLHEWNDTAAPLPDATLLDLFREQVAHRPDAIALSSPEGDLTYFALHHRATRLAHHLATLGAGQEVPVALLADRSPSMIIGLLAILEAGGAYLPLDPSYPPDRLAHMRETAGADLLLANPALVPEELHQGTLIPLTHLGEGGTWESGPGAGDWTRWAGGEGGAPEGAEQGPLPQVRGDNLAYVMFTSGSTGRPKATGVTHRNVVRLVRESRFADLGADQVFLQLAPISFDASTLEIWGALANGGRLVLAPAGRTALEDLASTIETGGVTTLWLTAGLFHQMVDGPIASLRGLRQLLAGGDVLSPDHVRRA
ncbi:MAG TPA: condensation domain-containing protein, partial [Thermoanaerobaculia bacterium]|nr:condensation domain-containing protein [Thermoanaerobaculia bacterium]